MRHRTLARGAFGAVLLLASWEAVTRGFSLPAYMLPAVSQILAGIATDRKTLLAAAGTTTLEALLGYSLGALCGIALALFLALLPPARRVLMPAAMAINSVPVAAYSPLVLLWFGIGIASKIALVAVAVGFTLFLSTLAGLDRVDPRSVDLLRSFGAGRLAILWRLRLPTALPLIAAGLRIATVRSILVAIVTEMLGAYSGLGWVVYQAVTQIDFVQVWAAIFVASAISLSFFGLVSLIEKRVIFWK